ncbi:MAG: 2-phosphosulfolactate phosphatase [Candidatus Rifleibacteriota bacterium]
MIFDQQEFDIRCEWGLHGAEILAPLCDAVVVVDVLSFTTAVSVVVNRGGVVFPYRWKDDSRMDFARKMNAILAGPRGSGSYSLSPLSLLSVQAGERIVLPSPNGSTISLATGDTPTYAGCLRNAKAVAKAVMKHGRRIGVVPCGERWQTDASLRPALEDLIGAGAVIAELNGSRSPEASAAVWAFQGAAGSLQEVLENCSSGKELIERGHRGDIAITCDLNSDNLAPELVDLSYIPSRDG